jgi:hypothetical protein
LRKASMVSAVQPMAAILLMNLKRESLPVAN